MPDAGADQSNALDSIYVDEVNMIRGELITVKVYSLTRVSVTDPNVADIEDASDEELLLVGRNVGQTALFIWDEHGKRTIMVYVFSQNLDIVKSRIEKLLKAAGDKRTKLINYKIKRKELIS